MSDRESRKRPDAGSKDLMEEIVRQLPDIVYRLDRDGRITFINDAVRRYGYAPEELLGRPIIDLVHPEDCEHAAARIMERRSHRRDHTPCEVRLRPGLAIPTPGLTGATGPGEGPVLLFQAEGIYDGFPPAEDGFAGTQGVARDVTHLRRQHERRQAACERLWQARKLQALGQLACGLAQEMGEILESIDRFSGELAAGLAAESEGAGRAAAIRAAAGAGIDLVHLLRGFGLCGLTSVVRLDAGELVDGLARDLAVPIREAGDRIEIREEHAGDDLILVGDPQRLAIALHQLGRNALEAMPEGGRLTLAIRPLELTADDRHGYPDDVADGKFLEITVSDTGVGLDAESIVHVFEPFFTTKDGHRGLGLAVAYGCVKDHLGAIRIASEPETGTDVRLLLPRAGSDLIPDGPRAARDVAGGRERLLLVGAEETVRNFGARALRALGYTVVAVPDDREAVAVLASDTAGFDLMILDADLDPDGGLEAFRRIRREAPWLKALLAASRGPRKLAETFVTEGGIGMVGKPFHLGDIAREVRTALD